MNWKLFGAMAALIGVGASVALGQGTSTTIVEASYISNVFGQSNFVKNPNAKLNTSNVTVSSATVLRSISSPLVATSEFTITTSTATGFADWSTRTFDQGMKGQNCEARFTYKGFTVGSTTAQIRQGSNTVAQLTLTPSATDPRIASINFPCGDLSAATTFRLQQATAALTGTNEIGGIYVGLATNQANVAQAENVVQAWRGGNQTIGSGGSPTTVVFNSEGLDAYGEMDTSTGIFTAKRAGNYLVNFQLGTDFVAWDVGEYMEATLLKNSTEIERNYQLLDATQSKRLWIQGQQTVTLAVGDTLKVTVFHNRGANTDLIGQRDFTSFNISRFPSSSELVVTPERQNWFVDGYHTGNNPSLGTTAVATRTEITNGTMTFTPKTGSAPVATLCSSTNSPPALSTATTSCAAGNESMGITFNIPTAGIYKVCSEFQPNINVAAASEVDLYMFLEETATNANTALTTNRSVNRYFTATSTANNMTTPIRMCENFNFASVGQKAIRLMYQQTVAGTVNSAVIVADNYKERGIKWTVEPYDNQSNSALYVQGPVQAAATGAAIPSGYQMEGITSVSQSLTNQTNGNKTGTGLTLQPGVYFIDTLVNVALVAPTSLNCGITKTVNGAGIADDRGFGTDTTVSEQGNTTQAKQCKSYGYYRVTTPTTFYPRVNVVSPLSSGYTFEFTISAIRLN